MSQRLLIAPDKFKGCLSAPAVASAIEAGVRKVIADAQISRMAISDGGEGFSQLLGEQLGMKPQRVRCHDAMGRVVEATYFHGNGVAVMEMAEAAGMWRVSHGDVDPLNASTFGVGEMIGDAANLHGIEKIVIGLGGSATNDGGMGMAAALGANFLDKAGHVLEPTPAGICGRLAEVDLGRMKELPEILVACDVENPLLGARGATQVFGPQKGLKGEALETAESALARLVEVMEAHKMSERPGAGAAGGIGFGLMHFASARLQSGFEIFAEMSGLESKLSEVDLVITGEGSFDTQSLEGKAPVSIARLAASKNIPAWCICGIASAEVANGAGVFERVLQVIEYEPNQSRAMKEAADLIAEIIARNVQI